MNALTSLLSHAPAAARPLLQSLVSAQTRHRLFALTPGAPAAGMPDAGVPTVVGVSGGADSVCLLHALHQLAPHWGLALSVAHLDHALRPDSGDDAAWVAALARAWGLPLHSRRLEAGALVNDPAGLEAAARTARYAFFHAAACAAGGDAAPACVATAHHQDDQAETVLMNFLRGSGPAGLAGMAWTAPLPHRGGVPVRLVRPLLGVRRAVILAYCAAYGLAWRDDASNQDTGQLRNQVRHAILPQLAATNPALVATLGRTAELFAAEAARGQQLDRAALAALRLDADTPSPARIVLDADGLAAQDLATQRGVVRLALAALGVDLRSAGFDTIDRLLEAAAARHSRGPHAVIDDVVWTLLAGKPRRLSLHRMDALPVEPEGPYLAAAKARRTHPIPQEGTLTAGTWQLSSALAAVSALPPAWSSGDDPWRAYLDAEACGELALVAAQAGMKIAPLGMEGQQRSLGDLFTDRKVPVALRAGWPVVVDAAGRVVWVCGLALAHPARITAQTQQVRILAWQRRPQIAQGMSWPHNQAAPTSSP